MVTVDSTDASLAAGDPAACLVASLLAGLAAATLLSTSPGAPRPTALGRRRPPGPVRAIAAIAVILLTMGVVPPAWVVPGLVGVATVAGGRTLWRRRRARAERRAVGVHVLDLCEQLAGDLGAGRSAEAALDAAARAWAPLRPVALAQAVGADVPTALLEVARSPGADDLRLLAAAWRVAHRTGQGLTAAVDRVGRDLVAARATRRVVEGELASARATARLVAALPVAALGLGAGVGGDPVGFLLLRPAGWVCLAGGLALGWLGLWWIEVLAGEVEGS